MTALILAIVLGTSLQGEAAASDTGPVLDRYQRECARKKPETAACRGQRAEVERILLGTMKAMEMTGVEIDRKALRVGASASLPSLRAFSLKRLARSGIRVEDRAVFLSALEDPLYEVRSAALEAIRSDASLSRLGERSYDQIDSSRLPGSRPDIVPGPKELGAPVYPGATFRFFASGPERALFTTDDPPGKVVAFYSRGGKKVMTGAQITKAAKGRQNPNMDPAAIMALMQSPEGQRKLQEQAARMQARAQSGESGIGTDWTRHVEGVPGIEGARYVVLEEDELMGIRMPARVVVVWTDRALEKTAIVFPHGKGARTGAQDPETIEKETEAIRTVREARPRR